MYENTGSQIANATPRKQPTMIEALDADLSALAQHLEAISTRAMSLADRVMGGEPRDATNKAAPIPGTALGAINQRVEYIRTLTHELENQMQRLERIA